MGSTQVPPFWQLNAPHSLSSHSSPTNPSSQMHLKPLSSSVGMQVPLFQHGFGQQTSWSKPLHSEPVNPGGQTQRKPTPSFKQLPPFRQGLGLQKSTVSQYSPVYPSGQVHTASPMKSWHVPPLRQGSESQAFNSISQNSPVKRGGHIQVGWRVSVSIQSHVPWFWQGLESQGCSSHSIPK